MFILPIKRKGGHFMLISQKQDNSILMTFAKDFNENGIFSSPYIIFTFFEELLEKKKLVLLRGDILDYKLEKKEAKELLKNFFMFYLNGDLYHDFVYNFNHNSSLFDYAKYAQLLDISQH